MAMVHDALTSWEDDDTSPGTVSTSPDGQRRETAWVGWKGTTQGVSSQQGCDGDVK